MDELQVKLALIPRGESRRIEFVLARSGSFQIRAISVVPVMLDQITAVKQDRPGERNYLINPVMLPPEAPLDGPLVSAGQTRPSPGQELAAAIYQLWDLSQGRSLAEESVYLRAAGYDREAELAKSRTEECPAIMQIFYGYTGERIIVTLSNPFDDETLVQVILQIFGMETA